MKITNGEIRGTLVLAAILLALTAGIWLLSPSRHASSAGHDTVFFPEDSICDATQHSISDSAASRTTSPVTNHRKRKTDGRKSRRKGNKSTPATDRPSPLDTPV